MTFYHGSSYKNIEILEPRDLTKRNGQTTPLLYVTPDHAFACCFLFFWDDSWVRLDYIDGVHVMKISDKKRFYDCDKGGAVYVLPSSSDCKQIDDSGLEWAFDKPVKPMEIIQFDSAYKAMLDHGVKVIFT